jgi:hypothetical protein
MKSLLRFDTSLARGIVCRSGRGSLGSPRELPPPPVSMQCAGLHPTYRPPNVGTLGFIPPNSCRLSRAPSRSSSARALSGRATCQGFCPHRDITKARPLTARHPKPRYVPSTGVRSLTTVCSAPWLRGLFHPRAASRARPVQGLLSPRSASGSSPKAAPPPLSRQTLDGPCGSRRPLLSCLGHEAFIRAEARARCSGDQPGRRSLPSSGSQLLQAPHPSGPEAGYPPSTAHDVPTAGLRLRDRRRRAPPAC